MASELHSVLIMRRHRSGISLIVDWPRAYLGLDFAIGSIVLQAPRSFPVESLPITLHADEIADIQIVSVGDQAIRLIAFFVLLLVPYSITRWIQGGIWEGVITVAFILGDFAVASVINRWLTVPALRITKRAANDTTEQHVYMMGSGWQSPLKTYAIAQRMTDLLIVHKYRGLAPHLGNEQHWRKMSTRMVTALWLAGMILAVTVVSVFLSDLLTGNLNVP